MTKKAVLKALVCLCVAMTMFSVCAAPAARAVTLEEAKKKDKELKKKKQLTEEAVAQLSAKLDELITRMAETQKKLKAKADQIQKAEDELVAAKIQENDQYNGMKLRIRYMYEEGNQSMVTEILESQSITELVNRVEYASEMSGYDREMLEKYKKIVKSIAKKEAKLKKEYAELEELQDQLSAQHAEVEALFNEKQVQLSDIEEQIGDNAKELERLIAEAEAAKKAREEAAAAAKAAAARSSGGGGGGAVASYASPGASKVVGTGRFTHPCPGTYLSSGFGYRSFDHSFHKGYDFASHGRSMPTYAADDGTVVIAGWSNSAGNWVVINHGNGLVTKYMHHSQLFVHAGQTVKKGDNIGMSGTTGYSSGIHLHFQVELNGTAVNPGNYL